MSDDNPDTASGEESCPYWREHTPCHPGNTGKEADLSNADVLNGPSPLLRLATTS